MREWKTISLGDYVESATTWNPLCCPPDDVFNYIDLSAIDQDRKQITGARRILCGDAPSRARQLVAKGDILVSTVRPNLNGIAQVPDYLDGATASTGFCVLRPRSDFIDDRFLFQWVKTPFFVCDMVSKATGASYPAVSDRIILDSKIPLPLLPEQRRIAEVLDQAEALRAKRREALAQLDTLSQTIFLEMFGDPVTNPKGWPVINLGELIIDGPQNGLYKPSSDYGSGTPILRIDAFYDGKVTELNTLKRVRISDDERRLYALRPGDIVINRVNSMKYLGKSALIPDLTEPTVFESNMMRFSIDGSKVGSHYLVEYLQSDFVKGQIHNASKNAVNQSSINQKDVRAFLINVPPSDMQYEYARCITAVEKLKTTHRTSLAEMDALFSSLQHRAFKGEL